MLVPFILAAQVAVSCPPAIGPAVFVDVTGFRSRAGEVRVRVFGGPTSSYFDRKHALTRIEVPVPAGGRAGFCIPLPRSGLYAVDVRHDVNDNGKTDRGDGGGASGNPRVSLFDVIFGRKPDPKRVQVRVGNGPTMVPVSVLYLQGGSFKPWPGAR